jgi:hypothetical protein
MPVTVPRAQTWRGSGQDGDRDAQSKVTEDALLSSFGQTLGSADRKPALDQGEKVPAEAPLPTRRKTRSFEPTCIPLGGRARPPAGMVSPVHGGERSVSTGNP